MRTISLCFWLLAAAVSWVVVGHYTDEGPALERDESAAAEPPPRTVAVPAKPNTPRTESGGQVGPVAGLVTCADAPAAAGVTVELRGSDTSLVATAVTSRDGAFVFPAVAAGDYTLAVTPRSPYAARSTSIVVPTSMLVVTLEAVFDLVVHVADRSAEPATPARAVVSARVEIVDPSDATHWLAAAVTDARGIARLAAIPSGNHRLRVSASGFVPEEQALEFAVTRLVIDPYLRGRPLVVELAPMLSRLTGRLLDPRHQPVVGALIMIDTRSDDSSPARTRPVRARAHAGLPYAITDERGRFAVDSFQGVEVQRLLICAGRDDVPLLMRRILSAAELASRLDLEVHLPAGRRVEFRCQQSDGSLGEGRVDVLDGAWIHDLEGDPWLARIPDLSRWNRVERSAGRFVVPIAAGSYKVRFTADDPTKSKAFFVTLPADGPTTQVLAIGP